ncbi:MAG: ATP-binding protein [Candidatus Buchananbacteria bacterium]
MFKLSINKFLLRQKVALLVISTGLLTSVVICGAVFWYLDRMLVENKKTEITQLTIEQSHESNLVFANHQLFAKMLGTRTRVKEFLLDQSETRKSELAGIFSEYVQGDKKYLAIYLLDQNGNCLISTDPRLAGQNFNSFAYFQTTIKGQPAIDALVGPITKQFGYYFSYPVLADDKKVIGVLAVKIDSGDIELPIVTSEVIKSSVSMLADASGVIVASSQSDRLFKSLGVLSESEQAEIVQSSKFFNKNISPLQYDSVQQIIRRYDKQEVIELYDPIDGDQEMLSILKIGDLPFYLITETRLKNVTQQAYATVGMVLFIILIGLFVKSTLIYNFIKVFLRPLDQFQLFFKGISRGDFSKRITVKTKDEFTDLADSFNKMAEDLDDLYQNLDKKVKEQTKDISQRAKESDNQKQAILNILEDVEEEKNKTEVLAKDLEKFKLAVANASDHIVITDADGIILYANQGAEKITGFTAKEIVGTKVGSKQNWGGLMSNSFYDNLWQTIRIKRKNFIGELSNHRKNGENYQVNVSISPILNNRNEVEFFVDIEHDITKEKQIDRAKTEFVSLASHQLRTPLSAINWFAEMLLSGDAGKLKKEQAEYLKEIYQSNQRMVELVNALLNVSRLELGTFMIEPEDVDIVEISRSVLSELSSLVAKKEITLKKSYSKEIPKTLKLDQKLTRIIFQNLLSNAIKYTPEKGQVDLSIGVEGKNLLIKVADNGYGIPTGQQEKIFTKLFRADNVREKDAEGTGLGLYIVKSILNQSGGKIWFESIEGKGTTFNVTIPLTGMKSKVGTKTID